MIQKYYSKNAHTGVGGKDKAYTSPVVFLDITTPTRTAMLYESAGSTSPISTNLPSETWECPTLFPVLPHPTVLVGDFNSHHPNWGYSEPDSDGDQLQNWASCNDFHLIHDSKQRGTFRSARWNRDYSPDLCWISTVGGHPQPTSCTVLDDFPHSQHRPSVIHIGLQLPVIKGIEKRRWNFRKAD